jgi:hypothetical protein
MARRTAYQYIEASTVTENVRNCAQTVPATESQARPLTKLQPEEQPVAWEHKTPAQLPGLDVSNVAT